MKITMLSVWFFLVLLVQKNVYSTKASSVEVMDLVAMLEAHQVSNMPQKNLGPNLRGKGYTIPPPRSFSIDGHISQHNSDQAHAAKGTQSFLHMHCL